MTTKWIVTTASERVALDEATRGGEATFMVTNQSPKSARAMFDIKTGDGVEESWFSVEDPQRPIRPAASVPYLVKIQVPQQVPPGQYEFEARVYPPDSAPEENFVLSRRVLLEVPKPPEPPKKKFPWWIIVAAALLVLVIVVVAIIVWPSGGTPDPSPSASPTPSVSAAPVEMVIAPGVVKTDVEAARKALNNAGLAVGNVVYLFNASAMNIYYQSVPAGLRVPKGTRVDLLTYVPFGRPTINSPGDGTTHPAGQWPRITWTQTEQYVNKWQVTLEAQRCTRTPSSAAETCTNVPIDKYLLTGKEYIGPVPKLDYTVVNLARHSGWVSVAVTPVDDLGNVLTNLPHTIKFFMDPPK